MLKFLNSFQFSINIHNNVIEIAYNIDTYIKKYIEENILYKQKNGLMLFELKSFKYSYPKSLSNIIYNNDRFKIFVEAVFNCIKFVPEMIINDIILNTNNKIEKISLFTKHINDQINVTCIDKHENTYTCRDYAVVKKINFINNNVNIIIEKFDNNVKQLHFNPNFDQNNNLIDIIRQNIDDSFVFNVDCKRHDFMSVIKQLSALKKKTNYIMTIDSKKITISEYSLNLIPNVLLDQYFNHLLINLYNYFILYKLKT